MKVFIAGSANNNIIPKYTEGMEELSKLLLKEKVGIVCIASSFGLIGTIYNHYKDNNGDVDIIIAKPYAHEQKDMRGKTEIYVESLYDLQQIALKNTDATLILPGGNGTLAELYMITDNIKTKLDTDPVIIYNCNGFYNKVKELHDFLMEAGVMEKYQYDYFKFCDTPKEVIAALKKYTKHTKK